MKPKHLPRELDRAPRYAKGQLVRVVRDWTDTPATVYRVHEDNGDRLTIEPVVWAYPIVPRELVAYYMVKPLTLVERINADLATRNYEALGDDQIECLCDGTRSAEARLMIDHLGARCDLSDELMAEAWSFINTCANTEKRS